MPYEELDLTTPDGVRIKAFLMLDEKAEDRPTVILLHANAGNVVRRVAFGSCGGHVSALAG